MSQLSQVIISHQIWLQRLGTQTASLSIPFVNKMRAEVREAVLKFGDDARTVKKLNKMLASLDGVLADVTGDWKSTLEKSLREIADYENKWFIHTLEENTKAETFIAAPTAQELWAAVKFAPLALSNAPVGVMDLMSGWAQTERNRLVRGVQTGFVQGQTTRQIVSAVTGAGGLADISERNVMTVVRTAVSHVSNTARDQVYGSNSDIVKRYQWVSTLDSRTSTVCKSRDGQKYEIGKGPMPPAHPNCLLGDTVVSTCSRVSNVFKRSYKGVVVYITTKSGRTLSITPNHQVMTSTGWVEAGKLNLGSKLVCGNDVAVALHHQENNVVAEFADLFSAVNVSVDSSAVTTSPTAPEDFHGDGSDGEVEIVLIDRLSWDKVKAALGQDIIDDELPVTAGVDNALPSLCSSEELGMVGFSSADGVVRGGTERASLLGGAISHPGEHSVTAVSCGDTAISQNAHDWVAGSADELSNFDWTNAVGVELDDVVNLVFGEADFCGHVYNLENEQNWYLANGIIAHNCRSTTIPVIDDDFLDFLDEGAVRAARGADGGTQVDASTTYYDFLKRQPAWFQDEALGPTRGKIFRNAGISPDEFRAISVDGFGRPLTLQQMADLDKRVADYLKGL